MAKNFQKSVFGLALGNMFLIVSLKAKLNACVGKYRMTLAKFPRQKDRTPCSADTRVKQFAIPAQHSIRLCVHMRYAEIATCWLSRWYFHHALSC